MKFHGEDQSFLGETLLRFASCGIFAYSTFNIVAGGLGVHTDLKNLLVFATGAITIIQVIYTCCGNSLFITIYGSKIYIVRKVQYIFFVYAGSSSVIIYHGCSATSDTL